MGRLIKTRVIIERKNTNKDMYYPTLISAYINSSYPWTCPTAIINLQTNTTGATSGYMSPIKADDIIRVQADIRYSVTEKTVWQDIFEGRIMKIEGKWGRDNNTTLTCRGHGEELLYRIVTADYSASTTRTGAMIVALAGSYLTRLTNAGTSLIDTATSTSIASYNIQLDTKYMVDAIHDFEALESFGYILKVVPTYDSANKLSAAYLSWQAVSATASTKVQVREGTPRLLEASFGSSIENLIENVTVYGLDGAPQKVGNYAPTPAYNTRYHVETDLSIATDALCLSLATAIQTRWGSEVVAGYVKILGDPNVKVGDLIYCRIPSIEINGSTIDGNYRCRRVNHDLGRSGWITDLDLGELDISPYELISGFHAKNRLENANNIS